VSGQLNALITSAPKLSPSEDQWAPEHVHAVKAYRENVGIAPLILIVGTVWRLLVTFTQPATLTSRKGTRRVDEPQSQSGHFGYEKKSLVHTGTRTPDRPPHSLVTVSTEICQILVYRRLLNENTELCVAAAATTALPSFPTHRV